MTTTIRNGRGDLITAIGGPCDVQALPESQLPELAVQMRRRLIETVTATGGHLGAGLGMVELTIALHRVFTSPHDIVVFDTGHQTYPHKLLTGRGKDFATLRQADGLSGYPNRHESPHDWVENSHASVSLAWVDGIAKALALQGQCDRRVIAVIGDGALTGGVAWEGLNNLGAATRPVIVVLNDNGRSYDPTAGALAAHLEELRVGTPRGPNLFENMGFTYIGPVDGHNIPDTCAVLRKAAAAARPVVVHAVTSKGRGYPPAEADERDHMHACGVVDIATGLASTPSQRSWTDVFEDEIARIADDRSDVVGLTAAMRLPTGLGALSRRYPHRVFDSGIAEQHLLASAAGLAAAGTHPVVAVYSTFLHRAFDQLLFDIGLHLTRDAGAGPGWGNRARRTQPSRFVGSGAAGLRARVSDRLSARRASATTTVAYRDRDRGSHRRAFPQRGAGRTDHGRTHHRWPRRLAYTTTALATRRALGRSGCHESTMHGRRPVPQRGADRGDSR